jgi:hypothetical protein
MKYKLLKSLPDIEEGSIFVKDIEQNIYCYFKTGKWYEANIVENNTDWFAPYLFTTEDSVDVFDNRDFWCVVMETTPHGAWVKGSITVQNTNIYLSLQKNGNSKYLKFFSTKEAAEQYLESLKTVWEIHQTKENDVFIWTKYKNQTFGHQDGIEVFYYNLGAIRANDMLRNLKTEHWNIYSIKNQKEDIVKIEDYVKCKQTNIIGKISKIEKETGVILAKSNTVIKFENIQLISNEELTAHLESLKPNFKVGDIVIYQGNQKNGKPYLFKIEEKQNWSEVLNRHCSEMYLSDGKQVYGENSCKLASNEEILKYYEQQGWVKGAKAKHNNTSYIIYNVYLDDLLNPNVYLMAGDYKIRANINVCELIKTPEYPKSWEELGEISGYYTAGYNISTSSGHTSRPNVNYNTKLFNSKSQAKSALAFAQLSQLHAKTIQIYNEQNNCDWKPVFSTKKLVDPHHNSDLFVIVRSLDKLEINIRSTMFHPLVFPTKELAQWSLENWNSLWKDYWEIN